MVFAWDDVGCSRCSLGRDFAEPDPVRVLRQSRRKASGSGRARLRATTGPQARRLLACECSLASFLTYMRGVMRKYRAYW